MDEYDNLNEECLQYNDKFLNFIESDRLYGYSEFFREGWSDEYDEGEKVDQYSGIKLKMVRGDWYAMKNLIKVISSDEMFEWRTTKKLVFIIYNVNKNMSSISSNKPKFYIVTRFGCNSSPSDMWTPFSKLFSNKESAFVYYEKCVEALDKKNVSEYENQNIKSVIQDSYEYKRPEGVVISIVESDN
jgi:hypothetical protein